MSKELPYFKFNPDQWLTGDITLEDMNLQGVFINVCAVYWAKDCSVAMARLCQRYGEAITRLQEVGLIKENQGFAVISFLDEQWQELSKYHAKNSENGKKGAETRWGKNGEAIALRKDKIRKEKKRKYNKDFVAPTIEEFKSYFKQEGYKTDVAERAWKGYDAANWHNVMGKKIRNWKQTCQNVWFKDDNKATGLKMVL